VRERNRTEESLDGWNRVGRNMLGGLREKEKNNYLLSALNYNLKTYESFIRIVPNQSLID